MADSLLNKAIDFTNIEDVCLAVWLEAVLRGQFAVAREILQTGLLAEHYRSLLADSRDDFSDEQKEQMAKLEKAFADSLAKFQDRPAPSEGEKLEYPDAVSPDIRS